MQILFKLIRSFLKNFDFILLDVCDAIIYIFTESLNISEIDARSDGQRLRKPNERVLYQNERTSRIG